MKIIFALIALLFVSTAYAHDRDRSDEPKVRIHIDLGFNNHGYYHRHYRHYERPRVIIVPGYVYRRHNHHDHRRHDHRRHYR